jgi:hypothetical protein
MSKAKARLIQEDKWKFRGGAGIILGAITIWESIGGTAQAAEFHYDWRSDTDEDLICDCECTVVTHTYDIPAAWNVFGSSTLVDHSTGEWEFEGCMTPAECEKFEDEAEPELIEEGVLSSRYRFTRITCRFGGPFHPKTEDECCKRCLRQELKEECPGPPPRMYA